MLGPRTGKYTKEGKPNAIPGHNIPIGALGVFILWFCWFGFNCGSTTAATTSIGDIAMTTNLAAAASTLATLIFTWIKYCLLYTSPVCHLFPPAGCRSDCTVQGNDASVSGGKTPAYEL